MRKLFVATLLTACLWGRSDAAPREQTSAEFFEKQVRPLLAEKCWSCHGVEKQKGNLRLDSAAAFAKGGENGPVIVSGNIEKSVLIQAIRRTGELKMPPKEALTAQQVAVLEKWIKDGAKWPAGIVVANDKPPHWAFRPLNKPAIPAIENRKSKIENPIDLFILQALQKENATLSTPANRRTLIRRVTFDLTGLPPTPEEIDAFLNDVLPDAYEKLIDRLLASPHYGERWGRHWLDVVRYADTAGETADYPAPHAWRYRNYVVDSFNRDKPYDRFIQEQIAGDLLAKDAPAGQYAELVTATGYLAIARRFGYDTTKDHYLTIEDTIDTVGKSIMGLTIACARCHDHKYDPITVEDYYGLYGIFNSTRFPHPGSEKDKVPNNMMPLMPAREIEKLRRPMQEEVARLDRALKEAEAKKAAAEKPLVEAYAKPPFFEVSGDMPNGGAQVFSAGKNGSALGSVKVRAGDMIELAVLPKANHGADSTLVELTIRQTGGQGRVWDITRDTVADFYQNGNGSHRADAYGNAGVWLLYDLEKTPTLFTRYAPDELNTKGLNAWKNQPSEPAAVVNNSDKTVKFSTVTMPPKSFEVHPGPRGGVAVAWQSPMDGFVSVSGRVADNDGNGGDGIAWRIGHRPGIGQQLAAAKQLTIAVNEARRKRDEAAARQPPVDLAYAVTEGTIADAPIQKRGDPEKPGALVPRKFVKLLGDQHISNNAASGRLDLARWLTDPKNPLTTRVMANRIWQHHFGMGLVKTPNDFGTRGQPPTHPELLDYLASRFIESSWSIKSMHRLILTSQTYQQSSTTDYGPLTTGYSHFIRRRLDAEEIRDALLAASGDLDRTPAGAHPFPPEKSWGYTQHTPFQAVYDNNKRSVYLMTQRIKRHPFLALFDGADPNTSTADRLVSTVPTQALYFMNDPFFHACAESFARRILAVSEPRQRINSAWQIAVGRPASAAEIDAALRFIAVYQAELNGIPAQQRELAAWAAYGRVLLGGNEFLFVD